MSSNGKAPSVEYTCPACQVQFSGPDVRVDGTPGKRCPAGHWHSYYQLRRYRDTGAISKPREPKPIESRARDQGLTCDRDRYQLAATAMLAGYDRAMATLPPGARLLVEGAFGKAPIVTREILGAA